MKYLTAILALAGSQTMAEPCAPHDYVTQFLADNYNETRQIVALTHDNNVVEFFASDDGTWTIAITRPNGPTCLVIAGQYHEAVTEPLGEPG